MIKNKVASVLARLKQEAKQTKITLQQLLSLFCQEEFLRRLARSEHRENLILKGGYLLYSLSGFTTRPTIDSDFLLQNCSADAEEIKSIVLKIIAVPNENAFIQFAIKNIEPIKANTISPGFRINLIGGIGKTKTPFNLDFGIGDLIVPATVERTLPVLLKDFVKPTILTYSLESTIAEKLDAIISLMEATSRMKDFYDIYYLATTFDFDGETLQKAIEATMTNRNTPYEKDSVNILFRFCDNALLQNRWHNFCKKILKYDLDFSKVVSLIIVFLSPPYEAMTEKKDFHKNWTSKERKYL